MKEIGVSDLHRIIFGDAPVVFMIEVLVRTLIIYAVLLLVVKWMGKRMAGQLTVTELAVMIMLGAIVAPAVESPEKGIVLGIMTLFVILIYHRGLTYWGVVSNKVETLTQGKPSVLVKDGVIQTKEAKRTGVTHAQIIAVLRKKEFYNLGQISRMYLEACGLFAVYEAKAPKPGLSLLPVADDEVHTIQHYHTDGIRSCTNCGNTQPVFTEKQVCTVCRHTVWTAAVKVD